ncbi:MAG: MATE family efflux transporter [Bacteroidetes bacterium]|nr:MAG: MATE family efflux transporter [Bacteroidota bacterium]
MARDLTIGKESKQIILFALPVIAASIFQQLYNVVDSIIVGNVLGKEALAAVGASFPVIFVLISLLIGISSGVTVVVSQYFGAKQYDNVVKAINTFYVFIFIASIIMSIFGIYFSEDIFIALKLPTEVLDDAVDYLQIYLGGMVFMFAFYGTNGILRGMGDSRSPLYFTIFSTILNIGLDLLFVMVFDWGIKGVAYASVIAQAIAFIGVSIRINKGNSLIHFSFENLVFDWKIFAQSLRIGLPTGAQQSFVAIGMIAIMRIVNDFGTDTIAAFTAASRLDSFASMPAMAFSTALATFVGQNIGANKIERVRRGFYVTLMISSTFSVIVSIIMYFFGTDLIGIFTNDPNVIAIGYSYLVIVSSFYVIFSAMFTVHGLLRGAGDTIVLMFITIFALWFLRIPVSYYLSRPEMGLGSDGIWWGVPIGWSFGLIASFIYYKMGRWKTKAVVKHEKQFEKRDN